ncbi:uncharacterized protein LOC125844581 isoform X4 [Solanum stenotomum]|uniref:uncharacterized protein LOC125844581 isoform X4 n=1 Tax=Solanum stenotomum TaxID=172797 RepID=UPI0020D02258|nr:uncharacterized protein LOC125844581 isoform X4 [Solanum stenotomum]
MSAVGLLPAALQGIDIREMLAGAALMDEANRTTMDMVVLPYKDSLLLFSRYLQYLVMESPGKEFDLDAIFNNYETVCTISLQHLLKYCIIGPLVMIGSLNLELLLVTTSLECYMEMEVIKFEGSLHVNLISLKWLIKSF